MEQRLYKSNTNKIFCGVCGGLGEYFEIDPVVVRVGWILFCAMGFGGIIAYIIAAFVMPNKAENL